MCGNIIYPAFDNLADPFSPTSPTMSRLVSDSPISLAPMLALRLQIHRLSKKLGVLNEDGVYSCFIHTLSRSTRERGGGLPQKGGVVLRSEY